MIYRLKIETLLREAGDIISEDFNSLANAVTAAERYKARVWILDHTNRIVAEWTGVSWATHGLKL